MYPTIPTESLPGVFEMLCYFSTMLAAMISYLIMRPA